MIAELMVGCMIVTTPAPVRCRCAGMPPLTSVAAMRPYVEPGRAALVGRAIGHRTVRDTFAHEVVAVGSGFVRGGPVVIDFTEYTVVVTAFWGNGIPDTIAVRTPADGSMCGVELLLNRAYLFLSHSRRPGSIRVDRCFPPLPAAETGSLMDVLDQVTPRTKRPN